MQSLDDDLREGIQYQGDGVLVSHVADGSPAERAGLRQGDVIVSINGKQVSDTDDITSFVQSAKSGDHARFEIARASKRQTLTVTLGERPANLDDEGVHRIEIQTGPHGSSDFDPMKWSDTMRAFKMVGDLPMMSGRGRLGVELQDIDSDLGSYFSVPDGKGALIVRVEKDTPAARAGLKAGDVIVRVGDSQTDDTESASRAIRASEGKTALTVMRRGKRQVVTAELPPRPQIERIVRGHGAMSMDEMPMIEIHRHDEASLHREMQKLREEIEQLREELKQKSSH
jgi:serine protease Do